MGAPQAAPTALSGTLPLGLPAALYGVRMWAAVCLALYLAFRLQLDDASWAGTTAAIVCQPAVGASLRKGWFRMIGTVIGAVAIVAMTALFPQSRAGLMLCLALWSGVCAMAATLLRNFASYAAALAGYTAAIIAAATLGAVGGPGDAVFLLAISRATEILLGIACASVVLAVTDFGGARLRLDGLLAAFSAEIARGLCGVLQPGGNADAGRPQRRDLLRRAGGLGVAADQAAGEISSLPFRPRVLETAIEGLYGAISAWRVLATHLEQHPEQARTGTAARIREQVPADLVQPGMAQATAAGAPAGGNPARLRAECRTSARRLLQLDTGAASERLLADGMAEGMLTLSRALAGVVALRQPGGVPTLGRAGRPGVPDWLPPVLAALRAFLTVAVAQLVWVVTAWPSGGTMVLFAAVTVILFAPREDAAYRLTLGFLLGTLITAAMAAAVAFAVLPQQSSFAGLCLALGVVLVPAGALSAQAWQQTIFVAMATNFIPLLAPANRMTYDPAAFYNTAMALLAGVALAALAMRLLPPPPPHRRARRLLTLTLRDLRRLTRIRRIPSIPAWERRVYARLAAMPAQVELATPARLAAAMFVGRVILRLRRLAPRLGVEAALRPVLDAIRDGDSSGAIARLSVLDRQLDVPPGEPRLHRLRQRLRGGILALAEALAAHRAYFDAELPDP